jgi:hypothetical protein
MKKAVLTTIISSLLFVSYSQKQLSNDFLKTFQKSLGYPEKQIKQKNSCLILLQKQNVNGKDTLIILNKNYVNQDYFNSVIEALKSEKLIKQLKEVKDSSIIPLLMCIIDENNTDKSEFLDYQLSNSISQLIDSKRWDIYKPIVLFEYTERKKVE